MTLTPSDLEKESRKRLALGLFSRVEARLEDMRLALERERLLEAMASQEAVARLLEELRLLLAPAPALESRVAGTDTESLQAHRRSALNDHERLKVRFAALCTKEWRSGADQARGQAVRRASLKLAALLALAVLVLSGWWGWQQRRAAMAEAELNRVKAEVASQGVKLIRFVAWLAERNQGRPAREIARDMTDDCSGIDLKQTLPNNPCREAWASNRQAIFHASIPEPGKPVDCPSELFFDPWGGPYVLMLPQQGTGRVLSAGPDGLLGTADDVAEDIPSWGAEAQ